MRQLFSLLDDDDLATIMDRIADGKNAKREELGELDESYFDYLAMECTYAHIAERIDLARQSWHDVRRYMHTALLAADMICMDMGVKYMGNFHTLFSGNV